MNLLIIYASNSGSNYLVGKSVKEQLSNIDNKLEISLKKAVEVDPSKTKEYDVILMGSPSWDVRGHEGSPHETILDLMDKLKNVNLTGKNFALYGCGDSSYLHFCGAVDYMESFVNQVGGNKLIDSLRIDSYYFDLEKNESHVKEWAQILYKKLPVASLI